MVWFLRETGDLPSADTGPHEPPRRSVLLQRGGFEQLQSLWANVPAHRHIVPEASHTATEVSGFEPLQRLWGASGLFFLPAAGVFVEHLKIDGGLALHGFEHHLCRQLHLQCTHARAYRVCMRACCVHAHRVHVRTHNTASRTPVPPRVAALSASRIHVCVSIHTSMHMNMHTQKTTKMPPRAPALELRVNIHMP